MEVKKEIVTKVCDMCGKEVKAFAHPRHVTITFRPVEAAGVEVYARGFGPGPGCEDICDECFDNAILVLADNIKKKSK